MDKPASDSTTHAGNTSNLKVVTNAAMHTDQKENANPADAPASECQPKAHAPKHSYWHKLVQEKPDRHIELLLTLAITFFAAVQLFASCNNNASTGQQTEQLIGAAKVSAYAAQQNMLASQNFATSAQGINQGVQDAVGRLQAQARTTELARETADVNAQKQLGETLTLFEKEQRPWVGFTQPKCAECTVRADAGQKLGPYKFYQKQYLTITDLTSEVVNTGKTPATNVQIHYSSPFQQHENEPVPNWDDYTKNWASKVMLGLPKNPPKRSGPCIHGLRRQDTGQHGPGV